jgi:hypothetical protein
MRCEGKNAGGRVWSASSGDAQCEEGEEDEFPDVKRSLSENSAPAQGSFEVGVWEIVRVKVGFGGVGGGQRGGRVADEVDATGGG